MNSINHMEMPKIYLLLLTVSLIGLTGCKKEKNKSAFIGDDIYFQEFNPFPEITSIDSIHNFPGNPAPTIYPSDSSASYLLDIDGDANPDFKLTTKHWYQWVSNSSPGANNNFEIFIAGIDSTSEISGMTPVAEASILGTVVYAPGESIHVNAKWVNTSWLVRSGGSVYGTQYHLTGTYYIGLRIKKSALPNYCWLKVKVADNGYQNNLQIIAFGYNHSIGNDISAGQQE